MILGARIGCWADRKPTARDYVQDGLVAMWDGIENAGWGEHLENPNVWTNLVDPSHPAIKIGSPTFAANSVNTTTTTHTLYAQYAAIDNSDMIKAWRGGNVTYEFCLSHSYTDAKSRFFFAVENSNGSSANQRILQMNQNGNTGSSNRGYTSFSYQHGGSNQDAYFPSLYLIQRFSMSLALTRESTRFWVNTYSNSVLDQRTYKNYSTIYWDPNSLDDLGVTDWFVRIGRTHNNSMSCRFHNIRIYGRTLSPEEIARNYAIDKIRFNLP